MEYYIDPIRGLDSNPGTQDKPTKTWGGTNKYLLPGNTIHAAPGKYIDGPQFTQAGTVDKPIKIIGEDQNNTLISKRINFAGFSFIHISNLTLDAVSSGWFDMTGASHHNFIKNIRLTATYRPGVTMPYVGGQFRGNNHTFIDSIIEGWVHGDAIDISCSYSLIENIDCSKCDSPHGVFALRGSHNIIRGRSPDQKMIITNRWDRAGDVYQMDTMGAAVENLLENLHIKQCNWDGEYPIPPDLPGTHPGALQIMKIGGNGNIYRNIIFENCYISPHASYEYVACQQAGNFMGGAGGAYLSKDFCNSRFYNIEFIDNELNAISFTANQSIERNYTNNIWFNCIFRGNKNALWIQGGIREAEFPVIHHCIVEDSIIINKVEFPILVYETLHPSVAWDNTEREEGWVKSPLTIVTAASTKNIIDVDDARGIHDGKNIILGDVLVIGNNDPVRTERKLSPTQIQVDRDIIVTVGDPVWQKYDAPAPTPPIPPDPPIDPTPPVVVRRKYKITGIIELEEILE